MKKLFVICAMSVLFLSTVAYASNGIETSEIYNNIEKVNSYGMTPPTSISTADRTTGDWSGIIYYTYTSHYFRPSTFLTIAETPHKVDYFKADGDYLTTQYSQYINGAHTTTNENIPFYYYAKITNLSTGIATNAHYVATVY